MQGRGTRFESRLAGAYSLVACLGFAIDAAALSLGLHLGLAPAWARLISLTLAMQLTFWVNGLVVFHCLTRKKWAGAWLGYMLTSGLGNLCNYWVFVTLASLHHPLWSNRWLGLVIGGLTAWTINYACARFLVFGVGEDGCTPIGEALRGLRRRFGTRPDAARSAIQPPPPPVEWRDAR